MNWKEYKVDISNIKTNPKYQRPLNETWVRKIVKNFDDSKVNQIILSASADGQYSVIDGQHTIEAVRRVKGEHVLLPAKIFFNLTEKEEADLFYTYNNDRKALTPNDKIRARWASGDADIVYYFDALEYIGIPYSLASKGKGLNSHSQTSKVYSLVGEPVGLRAMMVYKDAKYVNAPVVLTGLMWFIFRHPEIDDDRLTKKLSVTSVEELRKESFNVGIAAGYTVTSTASGGQSKAIVSSVTRIMAKTIATYYNKGAKTNRIDIATV